MAQKPDRRVGRLAQKLKASENRLQLDELYRQSGLTVERFAGLMNTSPNTLWQYLRGARGTPGLAIAAARWALFQAGGTVILSASDSQR